MAAGGAAGPNSDLPLTPFRGAEKKNAKHHDLDQLGGQNRHAGQGNAHYATGEGRLPLAAGAGRRVHSIENIKSPKNEATPMAVPSAGTRRLVDQRLSAQKRRVEDMQKRYIKSQLTHYHWQDSHYA